jgi:succinate-semialdehyde dehydrogenase/glutarate-semialdehyde dehydrogenase
VRSVFHSANTNIRLKQRQSPQAANVWQTKQSWRQEADMSGYPSIKLFINGDWIARSGEAVINPCDETAIGTVPHATEADLDGALAAAVSGFEIWRGYDPERRHQVMMKAINLFRQRADGIAATISLEQGKPLAQAHAEVMRGADLMAWDAEEGRRAYGRVIPSASGWRNLVLREPVGPVAAFTPWSAPASAPGRKIGGALGAGCSIILKACEETPGGAVELVRCFEEAGLPKGVVNLVFGTPAEISRHLIDAPETRLITFTGSVPVGIHLAELAAKKMKPVIMELGGHSPVFICADADPVAVARLSAAAKFRNAGQVCISPTRFFVHQSIHDEFLAEFARATSQIRVGAYHEANVQMGPLANARRVQAMEDLTADALDHGARLVVGGKRLQRSGYFFEPTILADVPVTANIMQTEPFGPIAAVSAFTDLDAAIAAANKVDYGLAAYAFSDSAATLDQLTSGLKVHLAASNIAALAVRVG